jgi:hypothetical protein
MYEWAELRHFRYLLTILERQGFRAAAEELRTAQPNLSVQARQFQENASVRLFRKMRGGRLLELLRDTGVHLEEHSFASHPSEMQTLVKGGHGLALIREGANLDEELTTRPIAGVDWTVDTALIYHKVRHPKTVPILVKRLMKQLPQNDKETAPKKVSIANGKRPSQRVKDEPVQMRLIG